MGAIVIAFIWKAILQGHQLAFQTSNLQICTYNIFTASLSYTAKVIILEENN